jgi:chemotaxis protein CheD
VQGGSIFSSTVRRITVMQGQTHASDELNVELTTVLGSCVAACLFDPLARVGAMNHFLLAAPNAQHEGAVLDEHHGLFLMEVLVNEMLKRGATRSSMRAHLYGGANLGPTTRRIGSSNGTFARRFLEVEGIQLIHADLGGSSARRLDFRPAQGRARCRVVRETPIEAVPVSRPRRELGLVELF